MLLLGVDAGGSTTLAALADETGQVLALPRRGPATSRVRGLKPPGLR